MTVLQREPELVLRVEGPLLYPNANAVKEHVLALVKEVQPRPVIVVLNLTHAIDFDVQAVGTLDELAQTLAREGSSLALTRVRDDAMRTLRRAGLTERLPVTAAAESPDREDAGTTGAH